MPLPTPDELRPLVAFMREEGVAHLSCDGVIISMGPQQDHGGEEPARGQGQAPRPNGQTIAAPPNLPPELTAAVTAAAAIADEDEPTEEEKKQMEEFRRYTFFGGKKPDWMAVDG
jgi:hypothetical protein